MYDVNLNSVYVMMKETEGLFMKAALHNRDFVLIISMCLIMVFGFFSTNPAFAVNANQTHTVTVKTGDTLWAIASKVVGEDTDIRSAIFAIKSLNHLTDNDVLTPGTVLKIPALSKGTPSLSPEYVAQN